MSSNNYQDLVKGFALLIPQDGGDGAQNVTPESKTSRLTFDSTTLIQAEGTLQGVGTDNDVELKQDYNDIIMRFDQ